MTKHLLLEQPQNALALGANESGDSRPQEQKLNGGAIREHFRAGLTNWGPAGYPGHLHLAATLNGPLHTYQTLTNSFDFLLLSFSSQLRSSESGR